MILEREEGGERFREKGRQKERREKEREGQRIRDREKHLRERETSIGCLLSAPSLGIKPTA